MRIFTHSKTNIHISKVRIRTFVLGIIFSLFGGTLYANPIHPTSTVHSRNAFYSPSATSAMGSAEVIQQTAPAYKMANTSAFKMASTYAPAQTIYTPFSDETPSSNSLGSIGGATASNGKDGFLNPGDPNKNEGNTEFPLGDAWSLLIFAAIGAGVIYFKQRKRIQVKD